MSDTCFELLARVWEGRKFRQPPSTLCPTERKLPAIFTSWRKTAKFRITNTKKIR